MQSVQQNKTFTVLCFAALVLAVCVIMLGSYTRLKDSGLGCPDWPGCYGHLDVRAAIEHVTTINQASPDSLREAHKTVPEMVHRYFASTLGLLILLIAALAIKNRQLPGQPLKLPLFLVALVIFQGILGKWTVTMGLYPPTVLGHLLGGFTTVTLLAGLAFNGTPLLHPPADTQVTRLKPWFIGGIIIVLIQIALGGWTAANYAAAVCSQLPICEGGWQHKINITEAFRFWGFEQISNFEFGVLDNNARTTIHVAHRIGAIITTLYVIAIATVLLTRAQTRHFKNLGLLLIAIISGQFLLGISNVLYHIPLQIAVAHNAGGALLLMAMALGTVSIKRNNAKATSDE